MLLLLAAVGGCAALFLAVYLTRYAVDVVYGYHDIPESVPVPVFECDHRGPSAGAAAESSSDQHGVWKSRNPDAREGRRQSELHLDALSEMLARIDAPSPKKGQKTAKPTTPAVTFAVSSECTNFRLRQAIRDTWGATARRRDLALIFFVGTNIHNSKCDVKRIGTEYETHKDVVQLNIEETYDNLSKKTREIFSYVWRVMSPSAYIAKLDDDVYVDVDALVGRLAKATMQVGGFNSRVSEDHRLTFLAPLKHLKVYLGFMHSPGPVIRVPGCKWYDPKYPFGTSSEDPMAIFEPRSEGEDEDLIRPECAGGMFLCAEHCARAAPGLVQERSWVRQRW